MSTDGTRASQYVTINSGGNAQGSELLLKLRQQRDRIGDPVDTDTKSPASFSSGTSPSTPTSKRSSLVEEKQRELFGGHSAAGKSDQAAGKSDNVSWGSWRRYAAETSWFLPRSEPSLSSHAECSLRTASQADLRSCKQLRESAAQAAREESDQRAAELRALELRERNVAAGESQMPAGGSQPNLTERDVQRSAFPEADTPRRPATPRVPVPQLDLTSLTSPRSSEGGPGTQTAAPKAYKRLGSSHKYTVWRDCTTVNLRDLCDDPDLEDDMQTPCCVRQMHSDEALSRSAAPQMCHRRPANYRSL